MKKHLALLVAAMLLLPSCGQTPAFPAESSHPTSDISEKLSSNEAEGGLPDASTDNVDTVEDPYARKLCEHRIRWQVETEDCEKGATLHPLCALCGATAVPLALASFAHAYTVIEKVSSEGITAKCAYCGKATVLQETRSFEDFDRDEGHFTYTVQENGDAVITAYTDRRIQKGVLSRRAWRT